MLTPHTPPRARSIPRKKSIIELRTPGSSPRRGPDRYLPDRHANSDSFSLLGVTGPPKRKGPFDHQTQREEHADQRYYGVLKNEFDLPTNRNLFSFGSSPQSKRSRRSAQESTVFRASPLKLSSQRLLLTPRKEPRQIPKVPFKVLDAPGLEDDFYLNLMDWSCNNELAVGLSNCVYIWNGNTGDVRRLCALEGCRSSSLSWSQDGKVLAVGTSNGNTLLYDTTIADPDRAKLRRIEDHHSRVGAIAWNNFIMTTGSRDKRILHYDVRKPGGPILDLTSHKQEVCGLKWNADNQLASGGNDNQLLIWGQLGSEPIYKFNRHKAAVKAIAWSPHQRGLLASGGGTADRTIKSWNTFVSSDAASNAARTAASGSDSVDLFSDGPAERESIPNLISSHDTGSQVCNLTFSLSSNEILSTHGFSQNQIIVWKYPSMDQVCTLLGHTYRVIYLAVSPFGNTVVTGAGDQTLRFWNVFPKIEDAGEVLGERSVVQVPEEQRDLRKRDVFTRATVMDAWGPLR